MNDAKDKYPLARQLHLVVSGERVIWSQWRDGRITRRYGENGEDEKVSFSLPYKVDHDTYGQHINFKQVIATHEYNMTIGQAVSSGKFAHRPETIAERKLRRRNWWESEKDRRAKMQKPK